MDRCYLSNIIYSIIMNVDGRVIDMMQQMNYTIWEKYLSEYEIHLIVFTGSRPLEDLDEQDIYESSNMWHEINDEYIKQIVYSQWYETSYDIFPKNVETSIFNITNLTKVDVFLEIIKLVGNSRLE